MIEADRRLRWHELEVRKAKKIARDVEVWRRYESEYESRGVPGIGSEARSGNSGPGGSTGATSSSTSSTGPASPAPEKGSPSVKGRE